MVKKSANSAVILCEYIGTPIPTGINRIPHQLGSFSMFFHYSSKQLNSSNTKTPAHNGNANNSECMTAPALGVHAQFHSFCLQDTL